MERLKQFREIIFGLKVNVYSDCKNLVYTVAQSEYQIFTCWRLIIEDFWPNIKHISGVDNLVADTLSRFMSKTIDWYKLSTTRDLSRAKELFTTRSEQNIEEGYNLDLMLLQKKQQRYIFFSSFGPASKVPKLTHYGVV